VKIRIGHPEEDVRRLASKAEECMDIGRRAQRIECGIMQFEYLVSADRLAKTDRIDPRDLQEGMLMAAEEAMALETKLPEAARKDIQMIRKAGRALGTEAAHLPAKVSEKELARLRKKAKSLRGHMEAVWTAARYACSIPRPLPSPAAAAVAGRRTRG
jgi:hypothetical protein